MSVQSPKYKVQRNGGWFNLVYRLAQRLDAKGRLPRLRRHPWKSVYFAAWDLLWAGWFGVSHFVLLALSALLVAIGAHLAFERRDYAAVLFVGVLVFGGWVTVDRWRAWFRETFTFVPESRGWTDPDPAPGPGWHLDTLAKIADSELGLPRPAAEQHLSSLKSVYRLAGIGARGLGLLVLSLAAGVCVALGVTALSDGSPLSRLAWFAAPAALLLGVLDASSSWRVYLALHRRESAGAAAWADRSLLVSKGYAKVVAEEDYAPLGRGPESSPSIALGGIGRDWKFQKYALALPLVDLTGHLGIFGPPGTGKTKTFQLSLIRQWAAYGTAVVLDIKGELFACSAHYYRDRFRLDFIHPESSDRLGLIRRIYGDTNLAGELAAIICGMKGESSEGGGDNEQFWQQSTTNLLKVLLLEIAEREQRGEYADPAGIATILEFIAAHSIEHKPDGRVVNHLDEALTASTNRDVRIGWGLLRSSHVETLQNILVSLSVKLEPFRTPLARMVLTPPNASERALGIREIPASILREPGHAIFVMIDEGQATEYKNVLATVFGLFAASLRKTSATQSNRYCLFSLDEAGTVPIRGLENDINAGRGRGMCYALGLQSLAQLKKIYGAEGAQAIVQGIRTLVVLPGTKGETAEFFCQLAGKTTTFTDTVSNDATPSNERRPEVGRDLISADDIRKLAEYRQGIVFPFTISPVRVQFPPDGTHLDVLRTPLPDYAADSSPYTDELSPVADPVPLTVAGLDGDAFFLNPTLVFERLPDDEAVPVLDDDWNEDVNEEGELR